MTTRPNAEQYEFQLAKRLKQAGLPTNTTARRIAREGFAFAAEVFLELIEKSSRETTERLRAARTATKETPV